MPGSAVVAFAQEASTGLSFPCWMPQVWALQQGSALHAAGRTNRAKVAFAEELEAAYQAVPETVPRAANAAGLGFTGDTQRLPASDGAATGSSGGSGSGGERDASAALAGERG